MSENDTVAIDFDGVIHKYSKGWQDGSIYDEPVEGVAEALYLLSLNYNLCIYTARTDKKAIEKWMEEKVWGGKNQSLKPTGGIEITNLKPPALAYIDDRGLRFKNWAQAMECIRKISLEKRREKRRKRI